MLQALRARPRLWQWVLHLAGALLVGYLLYSFGPERLAGIVAQADPLYLAVFASLTAGGYWLRAWKWRMALGRGRQAVRLFFLAKVAGNWTPARVGELAPLMLGEHRNAQLAAWIFADRVLEIWLTVGMGLIGALSIPDSAQGWVPFAIAAMAVATVVLAAALWAFPSESLEKAVAGRGRVWQVVHVLHGELRDLGPRAPVLGAITIAAKVADFAAVMLLLATFGYHADFWLVAAARFAHALVSASPLTPDTTGAPYVAAGAVLHQYAGVPADTLTAALALDAFVIIGAAQVFYIMCGAHRLGHPQKEILS
jgi:hypothetical protein